MYEYVYRLVNNKSFKQKEKKIDGTHYYKTLL